MNLRIRGAWYSGRNAERATVVARLSERGEIAFEPPVTAAVPIANVTISARIGNIPRSLTLPDGSLFETDDHVGLDRWLASHNVGSGWVHRLETHAPLIAIMVMVLAGFVFATGKWGIPALSRHLAMNLPAELNARIAGDTLAILDQEIFSPSTLPQEQRRALLDDFARTVPNDDPALHYRLEFRDGGWIGANAFALPDGTIVVTDQLVRLAANDDEVLAVVFHEFGHVVHRHSLRQVIAHSGLALLSLLVIGDVGSAGSIVLALPSVLAESAYSRELEAEADGYALAQMRKHDRDPLFFATLMLRLQHCAGQLAEANQDQDADTIETPPCELPQDPGSDEANAGGWLRYLASHPSDQARVQRFRAASASWHTARR